METRGSGNVTDMIGLDRESERESKRDSERGGRGEESKREGE
jgi:hypothetical protein